MSNVKLIWSTPDAERMLAYCARVSNPSNQHNEATAHKLLKYCKDNQHWSVFEMANICMEIETTRDIARQILRHRSFSFQEFSQRYAQSSVFDVSECRLQDEKNRQNSLPTEDRELKRWWQESQQGVLRAAQRSYESALSQGIAKEVARKVLPEGLTMSRMYMNGTLRSWIHYCDIRCDEATQKEHRDVAVKCRKIISDLFPSLEIENA